MKIDFWMNTRLEKKVQIWLKLKAKTYFCSLLHNKYMAYDINYAHIFTRNQAYDYEYKNDILICPAKIYIYKLPY